MDGQRGVLLGFTAGERDCAAADTAPPWRHRLASRAGGGAILMLFGTGIIWRFCTTSPSGYMLKHMEKLAELKRAKLLALSLLLIAAAILSLPSRYHRRPGRCAKSYFRSGDGRGAGRLVCGRGSVSPYSAAFVARHTAIIPRNKDRIADNLGRFVEEKFP